MKHHFRHGSIGVFLFGLAMLSTAALGDPKADPAKSTLLTTTVMATDAKLNPLATLRPADLKIEDAGQPARPAFVYPLAPQGAFAAPLGPHDFSNRAGAPPLIVLFDLLNANFAERGYAWNDLAHSWRAQAPGGNVFIYLVTKDAKLYAVRALPEAGAPASPQPDASNLARSLNAAMHAQTRLRPWDLQVDEDARTQATLTLLRSLEHELSRMPGRKNVLWISHGAALLPHGRDQKTRDYTAQYRSAASDLAQAGIAVYAIDQDARRLGAATVSGDSLDETAAVTGGQVYGSDQFGEALERIDDDNRSLFVVGYYAAAGNFDGKFHALHVTPAGKEIRIRSSSGYFADSALANAPARLAQAALGPVDQTQIGLRVTAIPSSQIDGWVRLSIRVDLAAVALDSGLEASTGRLSLAFAEYATEWQSTQEPRTIPVAIAAGHAAPALRDGFEIALTRGFAAGARKIRVVVQDQTTGATGSVTIPASAWAR